MNIERENLNKNSINYRVKKLNKILEMNSKCQVGLFQAWLEQIILFPSIEKIMDNF